MRKPTGPGALLCALVAGCAEPSTRLDLGIPRARVSQVGELANARNPQRPASISDEGPVQESRETEGLTLDGALALADRVHPSLAEARARVEAAGGRALQAGLFPNPVAVARMESAPLTGSTTGEAEYVAGLTQRLPLTDRLSAARRVEELDGERLEKELEVKRVEIRRRVHGAFATALYLDQVVGAEQRAAGIGESGAAVARSRLAAGDAVPEELARAEMELVRVRLDLERARSMREQALAALVAAVGERTLRVGSLQGSLDAALELPTLESLSARLEQHPLTGLAVADVALQRGRVTLAEAQRIPDVNLDLFYRRLEQSETNSFDIGVGIPIPLFDRNQGRLREARAELTAAEARARTTETELALRVREAHAKLARALAGSRTLREEILPRAETVLRAAESRYAAGDASLTDVLPVRRDRIAVELAYLASLREVMEAWADLSAFVRSD